MKLYATTTSERASKGQGGNDYINIEITDENKNILGIIQVKPKPDGAEYVLPVIMATFDDRYTIVKPIDTGYRFSKGEKLKTAKRICGHCGIKLGEHDDLIKYPHYLLK